MPGEAGTVGGHSSGERASPERAEQKAVTLRGFWTFTGQVEKNARGEAAEKKECTGAEGGTFLKMIH